MARRRVVSRRIDAALTIELATQQSKTGNGEIRIDLLVEELERLGAFNPLSMRKSQLAHMKTLARQVLENAVDENDIPRFVNLRMTDKNGRVYHAYKSRTRMTGPEYIQATADRMKVIHRNYRIVVAFSDEALRRRGTQIPLEFPWDDKHQGPSLS
jgi:hypothetical protein